jgi:Phosphoesterase family
MVEHGRKTSSVSFSPPPYMVSIAQDPFNPGPNPVFSGPGFRLPFYVISPWTRGGHVFTAHSDHSSQIMFLVALFCHQILPGRSYLRRKNGWPQRERTLSQTNSIPGGATICRTSPRCSILHMSVRYYVTSGCRAPTMCP